MKVNVNTTRTAYEFSVVEGSYEFVGTYSTHGTGTQRELNATVNLVTTAEDASAGDTKTFVGNVYYNHPETSQAAQSTTMPGAGQVMTSGNINVQDEHFDAVLAIFKSVVEGVEAACV